MRIYIVISENQIRGIYSTPVDGNTRIKFLKESENIECYMEVRQLNLDY